MADLRLACTGARVGSLCLPPFALCAGELVCLHLPDPVPDEAVDELVHVLTGARAAAGVRLFGRVVSAFPVHDDRNGFLRLLRPLRASAWLRRQGGMSSQAATAALGRIGLDRDWPLTHLAGNPRVLLGLEAAWAGGADAIVFKTAGIDPVGVQAVYAAVVSKVAVCPAIHLSCVVFQDGQPLRDCYPEATCLDLASSGAPALPAESA
jgi:hypothetical protein